MPLSFPATLRSQFFFFSKDRITVDCFHSCIKENSEKWKEERKVTHAWGTFPSSLFSHAELLFFPGCDRTVPKLCVLPFSLLLLSHKHLPVGTVFVNSIWTLSPRLLARR